VCPFFLILVSLVQRATTGKLGNMFSVLHYICIRLLGVEYSFVNEQKLMETKGFFLPNHRSWFDFPFDSYITNGIALSRNLVQWAMLLAGLLQVVENRTIRFSRGNISRQELYDKIDYYLKNNERNVFLYPEGTRRKHITLSTIQEVQETLKPGLLKSIYEHQTYPVQIIISTNKEKCVDEKTLSICFGVKVKVIVETPIHPKDFSCFEDFYHEICR